MAVKTEVAGYRLNVHWITGEDPQGGHAPHGFEVFLTTCPQLALSCQKPGRQLRTNRSSGCYRSIVLCTYSGACSYWIGNVLSDIQPTFEAEIIP